MKDNILPFSKFNRPRLLHNSLDKTIFWPKKTGSKSINALEIGPSEKIDTQKSKGGVDDNKYFKY